MARQVLFIQGAGEGTHDTWDDKLVRSLVGELGHVRYPRMPDEASPRYATWRAAILSELATLDDGAILVGHSTGGAVLVNVLAEQASAHRPGGIFLVAAPFIGDGGWPSDDVPARTDLGARMPAGVPLFLYHGDADETVPVAHLRLYAERLPMATTRVIAGGDHQLNDDLRIVARDILALG